MDAAVKIGLLLWNVAFGFCAGYGAMTIAAKVLY